MLTNISAYLDRNNHIAGFWLLRHLSLIGLCSWAIYITADSPWLGLAMLGQGVVITFLFCAEHEMIHYTAFRSRWLNQWLARLIGFVLFLPADYFRAFHMDHHRYTQNPQADPQRIGSPPMQGVYLLIYLSGFYYWHGAFKQLCDALLGRSSATFITAHNGKSIILEGRIHVILYITLAYYAYMLQWHWLLDYWLIPLLIGQPLLRLYLLAEHHKCDESDAALDNSRTIYTHFWVRILAWNMPFHTAHHAYPGVAFHQLASLHEAIAKDVKHVSLGYWAFARSLWPG